LYKASKVRLKLSKLWENPFKALLLYSLFL